jgi:CRISPR/Cas system-associated protein Csm6
MKINVRKLLLKLITKAPMHGCARLNTLIQSFLPLIDRKVDYKMILIGNYTCFRSINECYALVVL